MIVITYSIGILTAGVIIYAGNSRTGPGSIRKNSRGINVACTKPRNRKQTAAQKNYDFFL